MGVRLNMGRINEQIPVRSLTVIRNLIPFHACLALVCWAANSVTVSAELGPSRVCGRRAVIIVNVESE